MLSRLRDPFAAGALRARNKPFLEAAMASAAFVASTGEEVSFARRHALDRVLENVERLKGFEVHAAIDLFDDFVRHFDTAPDRARARALKAISALAGQAEAAELLVRIAGTVARAEGEVSAEARAQVGEIARALGLAASEAVKLAFPDEADQDRRPTVIVLGNEKGGTGKSTTAMHLAVALAEVGHRVGCLDLDGRQATLSRYMTNRKAFSRKHELRIATPEHRRIERSEARDRKSAEWEERARFEAALAELSDCRFVVIDTPGTDSHRVAGLSRRVEDDWTRITHASLGSPCESAAVLQAAGGEPAAGPGRLRPAAELAAGAGAGVTAAPGRAAARRHPLS